VGFFSDANGDHGFLYSGGNFTTIDHPDSTEGTFAFGINDAGQIVGSFAPASALHQHGFLATPREVRVHVGYLNNLGGQPDPAVTPTPFNPDATTILVSSGAVTTPHDTGVIRFENGSNAPVTIERVTVVTDRECPSNGFFAIWDNMLPPTLAAGANLVLAETDAANSNFDSSNCGLGLDPVVIFKIKGGPQSTCVDRGRVLLGREDVTSTRETTPYQVISCVQSAGGPP
jgi:hypothetical protein